MRLLTLLLILILATTAFGQQHGSISQPSIGSGDGEIVNAVSIDVNYAISADGDHWTKQRVNRGYNHLYSNVEGALLMDLGTEGCGSTTWRLTAGKRFQIVTNQNGCLVVETITSK